MIRIIGNYHLVWFVLRILLLFEHREDSLFKYCWEWNVSYDLHWYPLRVGRSSLFIFWWLFLLNPTSEWFFFSGKSDAKCIKMEISYRAGEEKGLRLSEIPRDSETFLTEGEIALKKLWACSDWSMYSTNTGSEAIMRTLFEWDSMLLMLERGLVLSSLKGPFRLAMGLIIVSTQSFSQKSLSV